MVNLLSSNLPDDLKAQLSLTIHTIPHFWEQRPHIHFTNHGPVHSERVYQKLTQLVQELPEHIRLTNDEVFIVSAAAWLYEIGMQSPILKPVLDFDYQPGDTLSFAQLQQIREKKHLLGEWLILDSVRNDAISSGVQLGFTRQADAYTLIIAEVVRWCSKEPLEEVPETRAVNGIAVRVRLLVALLRLADQLYIDGSRVNMDLLQYAEVDPKEKAKWWAYHYTQTLPIAKGQIPFHYFLPITQKEYLGHIRSSIEPDFGYDNNPIIQYLWDEHQLKLMPHKNPTVQYDQPGGFQREMSQELIKFLRQVVTPIRFKAPIASSIEQKEHSLIDVDYENLQTPSFRNVKIAALVKRHQELVSEYEEANRQLGHSLDEVEKVRLKRQVAELEREIEQIEEELNILRANIGGGQPPDVKGPGNGETDDGLSEEPRGSRIPKVDLRLDVAVPDQVYLERTFELAVAIRRSTSIVLNEPPLTIMRSGQLSVSQPTRKSYTTLRIQVSVPECKIEGPDSYSIRLYHGADSQVFHFHLTPRKLGEISMVVRVYQEEDWLGSTSVHTVVQEEIVGSVTLTTTSEKLKSDRGEEMTNYLDFELHIDPHGHARVKSSEGERVTKISTTVPDNIQLSLGLIEENRTNERLLKDLGKLLYGMAFPGVLDMHFNQTEAVSRYQGSKVRIRLTIEADSLAQLPWEFMYREEGGYYLAVNPNTVLSRYLNLPLPPNKVRRREGPLHMLIIVADPSDQTRLDQDEWETIILDALATPIEKGQITTQTVKQATFEEISKALLLQQPDIIQFVGHGAYRNGKGYLALVDKDTGKSWIVDDERFAGIFLGHDDNLGLLCLATCESAKSDSSQAFLGIAPKIVQKGVPAVVAMQYPVLIKSAKIFLENFYTAVATRKPVDWAVQHGRNSVGINLSYNNREFATPVLYMRAVDGNIF